MFIRIACLFLLLSAGCTRTGSVEVIKLGHGLDTNHPVHQAMVFMQERLDSLSQGSLQIQIYPSQQLGTERQLLELLQLGSIGMTKVASAVLEGFASEYKVLSLPYLFRDEAHRHAALDGPAGRKILLSGEQYWLRGLTYYDAGSRSFYTTEQPIYSPEDLEGLKIRTLESATQVKMVNSLGGSATPIAWGEIYTSLQQGVVDGAENNPPSFYTSRHYEVCKYYSLDEHTGLPDVLLISTIIWNQLTPEQQAWVQQAADESAEYQKILWKMATDEALEKVQEAGVTIIYPDKAPFVERVLPIYDEYRDIPEIYALIEEIRSTVPCDSLNDCSTQGLPTDD
ncbi:MAG: TRAP transporter substrate-binding protein [Bacteroidetes bacterium]|nr:TRAP transporter substrate-binding protein [Bacteroidota bacterium]MCY4204092.1 TRAP transporter substrate-binding protein [Bacteroidota bacterium]